MTTGEKLHLGCGDIHIEGWVNIDSRYQPAVDKVDNIGILSRYDEGSISTIYCCHALDHFDRWTYKTVLQRWFNLLEPGGKLWISTPDFVVIMKDYIVKKDMRSLTGALYAAQDYPSNYRKVMFDYEMLNEDLLSVGFVNTETTGSFADDCSRYDKSLNVIAHKL